MDSTEPEKRKRLRLAYARLEILEAINIAMERRHEIVEIISDCDDAEEAIIKLTEFLGTSRVSSRAIGELRLFQLTRGSRATRDAERRNLSEDVGQD